MNPMTNMKNVLKLSEQDLRLGGKNSWHDQYSKSAWIFVGGLPYELSEGDVLCVFSQYGEIVNVNLVRDKATGKSKGFCFICYEDQRSTVLAVDNLNGIKLVGKTLRVDHVQDYRPPKDTKDTDEETRQLQMIGCAPGVQAGVEEEARSTLETEIEERSNRSTGRDKYLDRKYVKRETRDVKLETRDVKRETTDVKRETRDMKRETSIKREKQIKRERSIKVEMD
uniref:RRM domain-containing protein n=1 Tax=Anopheles farauti TaxID=69004 RepID=A0A182Q9G9_9DIPT